MKGIEDENEIVGMLRKGRINEGAEFSSSMSKSAKINKEEEENRFKLPRK